MLFLKKLSIYLYGLLNAVLFYLLLLYPSWIFYVVLILIVLLLIQTRFLIGKKLSLREYFIFFSLALLILIAGLLFLLILENIYLEYLMVILAPLLNVLLLELVYTFLYRQHKHQPFSLIRFFNSTSILIVFFITSALFAFNIFLSYPFWLVSILITLLAAILFYHNFYFSKLEIKDYKYFIPLVSLMTFELSALLTWWSISYYLKGFLITTLFYLIGNLFIKNIRQTLKRKFVIWKLIVILILILIILITARWF